jgi:hypothetical protein
MSGTGEQLDEVEQWLEGRVERKPHGQFFRGLDEYWTELDEHAPGVLCERSEGVLILSGYAKWVPALDLVELLREQFPLLLFSIGSCDEDGWFDEWEVLGPEQRLTADGQWEYLKGCGNVSFGVMFHVVKDGQPVTREQRQAYATEAIAQLEREWREKHGHEFTPEERELNRIDIESWEDNRSYTESGTDDPPDEMSTEDRAFIDESEAM